MTEIVRAVNKSSLAIFWLSDSWGMKVVARVAKMVENPGARPRNVMSFALMQITSSWHYPALTT